MPTNNSRFTKEKERKDNHKDWMELKRWFFSMPLKESILVMLLIRRGREFQAAGA